MPYRGVSAEEKVSVSPCGSVDNKKTAGICRQAVFLKMLDLSLYSGANFASILEMLTFINAFVYIV
jgi:hypothetical protein